MIRKPLHPPSLENRIALLRSMQTLIRRSQDEICKAVALDMGRAEIETHISELVVVKEELKLFIKNLAKWSRDQKVPTPFQLQPGKSAIHYEPYGTVLVIAPWNFPFHLSLVPAIGALAAGNKVILKTSPAAPHCSALLARLINEDLNSDRMTVVEGDETKAAEIVQAGVDFIFFTGSTAHGKEVYKLAAAHMLPVVMELGGQNPLIFHSDGDPVTIQRIVWGKFLNAGQTCLSPNHVFVHESMRESFLAEFEKALTAIYGENILESASYPRIINEEKFQQLAGLSERNASRRIFGGASDRGKLKIAPAVFEISLQEAKDSELITQEIFGPLLPVVFYNDTAAMLELIKDFAAPLATYLFTSDRALIDTVKHSVPTGSICVNDCLVQGANPHFPFGGVQGSGIGKYHGHHSFLAFSNAKSILVRSRKIGLIPRFPPIPAFIQKALKNR